MLQTAVAPLPEAHRRSHLWLCGLVTLEAAACFAGAAVALIGLTLLAPLVFMGAFGWRAMALVPLGWIGFAGVGRLVYLLWNRPQPDPRRWLTLAAIACGSAASLIHGAQIEMGRVPGGLEVLVPIVYLPLGCALHLVFLTRRQLFC